MAQSSIGDWLVFVCACRRIVLLIHESGTTHDVMSIRVCILACILV